MLIHLIFCSLCCAPKAILVRLGILALNSNVEILYICISCVTNYLCYKLLCAGDSRFYLV